MNSGDVDMTIQLTETLRLRQRENEREYQVTI